MQISIDYNYLNYLISIFKNNPIVLFGILLAKGAWLPLLISTGWGLYFVHLYNLKRKFLKKYTYKIIAIDVPKDNEQTIKAIEELFNTVHGIKHGRTAWETYTKGSAQLWISLEIVSIEGYIQFLVRAPDYYMETITSTIYAHYPEAEITEVEDYMSLIPDNLWTKETKYKAFLMEGALKKPNFYPIKVYSEFEHSMSQTFVDPMASLLEIMSKIGPGEFLGIVILARPSDNKAVASGGQKIISKLMGRAPKATDTITDKMINGVIKGMDYFSESVYSLWGDISTSDKKESASLNLLTSMERNTIAAIENKLNKIIFETKIKTCYIAPKEKYAVAKGRFTIQGAFKQFDSFNQFDFTKNTDPNYWGKNARVRSLTKSYVRRFKERNIFESRSAFLSTEELATIWHFPSITVKAPMVRTIGTKTVEPPSDLPLDNNLESMLINSNVIDEKLAKKQIIELKQPERQTNVIDIENKKFEAKFTKDKNLKDQYQKEFKKDEEAKIFQNIQNGLSEIKKDQQILSQGESRDYKTPPDNLPILE